MHSSVILHDSDKKLSGLHEMLAGAVCARSRLTFEITVDRFERGLSLFNSESPTLLVYIG